MKRRSLLSMLFGAPALAALLPKVTKAGVPQPIPPFLVGQKLSRGYIIDNYSILFKAASIQNDFIEDPRGPNDNWKHWIISRRFIKLTTFDDWMIWAEFLPRSQWYVVTEVKRV